MLGAEVTFEATSARRTRAGQRFEIELQDQLPQPAHAGKTNAPPRIPALHSRRKAISCSTPDQS